MLHIDADTLRRCLAAHQPGATAALPAGAGPWPMPQGEPLPAAVLVGMLGAPAPGVLLTKRTAHLRAHSGQVSFPGGRIDAEDESAEAAALREAREEVGLDPAHVEVIGRLTDVVTGTGYRITPVLALLHAAFVARPSPHEVAAVFQLPLAVLLDPAAPVRRAIEFAGGAREFWVWPHPEHEVWGATAAILVQLAEVLRGCAL